jgi:hypothetical protein
VESSSADDAMRSWAHVSLRLTDWAVRVEPSILDAVLETASLVLA